jgi:uncharacterized protein (TIGR04255 family)
MPFPESERVVYEKNPLEEVICQLRFPAILKIETEKPAAFQDRVRERYPCYKETAAVLVPSAVPEEVAQWLTKGLPSAVGKVAYRFASADESWALALNRDFLALTANNYTRWEEFKDRLDLALGALTDIYAPPFYERIGLRYRNVIHRSRIGMGEEIKWAELIRPEIAGVLVHPDLGDEVEEASHEIAFRLPDSKGHVRVRYGLAKHKPTGESCYVIDFDLFDSKQTGIADATRKLDFFHHQGRLLFRWCITDRLHNALGPGAL